MSQTVRELLRDLEDFKQSPVGFGHELRLEVADVLLRHLRLNDWTQRDLAERTGLKESYISRVVHGNTNCTLDTVGRLMHAFGVRLTLQDSRAFVVDTDAVSCSQILTFNQDATDDTDSEEETTWQEETHWTDSPISGQKVAATG